MSFDNYNEKYNNIYLVYTEETGLKFYNQMTPQILAPTLKDQFPEIENYARWKNIEGKVKIGSSSFSEDLVLAESKIFDILTLPILKGSVEAFKNDNNSVIITETAAKKYFGNNNPINKTLLLNFRGEDYFLRVVAIIKDIPANSTFITDIIAPFGIWEKYWNNKKATFPKGMFSDWTFPDVNTYVLLAQEANVDFFKKKLYQFSILPEHSMGSQTGIFHLMPLKNIYFKSSMFYNNFLPSGDIKNIYIYSTVALLCLFISLLTFLMMNSGKAIMRTKEICVKKVLGAKLIDLLKQSIIESLIITFLALPIAIILVKLFLPDLSQHIGQKISFDFIHHWKFILIFWLVTFIIGILSGGFVSYLFSKLNPVNILRNKLTLGPNKIIFRRVFLTIQLSISAALIFSSIVVYRQLDLFFNKDIGLQKEGLLFLYPNSRNISDGFMSFKTMLKNNNNIVNVTGGLCLPGTNASSLNTLQNRNNPNQIVSAEYLFVDDDFIETMGMKMLRGKSFKQSAVNDSAKICIINETAMKELGMSDPIGEKIQDFEIIGVVKDFNNHSLHSKIIPTIIQKNKNYINEIAVKIKDNKASSNTIKYINKISANYNNGTPMENQLFNERLGELYQEEHDFLLVIEYFTITTIIVICLGLYGMSSFVLNQRKKEIGIRKVLGATIFNILYTLSKEFFLLTIISIISSFLLSYYFLNNWLDNFYYRENIGLFTFSISCIIVIIIVTLAISFNAIKLAYTRPTETIRNE